MTVPPGPVDTRVRVEGGGGFGLLALHHGKACCVDQGEHLIGKAFHDLPRTVEIACRHLRCSDDSGSQRVPAPDRGLWPRKFPDQTPALDQNVVRRHQALMGQS